MSRVDEHLHLARLKDVLADIMAGRAPVAAFRELVIDAHRKGLPVDAAVAVVPDSSLEIFVRRAVLALPSLSNFHADARAWLAARPQVPGATANGYLVGNIGLGGEIVRRTP